MTTQPGRPREVTVAMRLLWLSAALTVFFTVVHALRLLPVQIPIRTGAVISNFGTAAFLALSALKFGAGRNWARWLLLAVVVFGSLTLPLLMILAPQLLRVMPPLLVLIGLVQCCIQVSALILAFLPASRAWFKTGGQPTV